MAHLHSNSDKDFEIRIDAEKIQEVVGIANDPKRFKVAMKYIEDTKHELDMVVGRKGILKSLKQK